MTSCFYRSLTFSNVHFVISPNDVVLYEIRGYDEPEMPAILELEGTDTIVSFYVTHPSSSTMLVLNAEQVSIRLKSIITFSEQECNFGPFPGFHL